MFYLMLSVLKISSKGQHFGTQIFLSPEHFGPSNLGLWGILTIFSQTTATGPGSIVYDTDVIFCHLI